MTVRYNPVPSTEISVLLPTRGRGALAHKSLLSLIENAKDIKNVEFLIAIDDDDQETINYCNETLLPDFKQRDVECHIYSMPRQGYEQLQKYVNYLGYNSSGKWLLFWNDDAVMQTQGWDEEIISYNGQLAILRYKDNHNSHPYSVFPIVPRDWLTLFECLSPAQQTDAWISQVAYLTDSMITIESEVLHDRADITGNNDDEIYKERVYLDDANTPQMVQMKQAYAAKWAWLRKLLGQDSGWYDHWQAGHADPWDKMMEMDVNNQLVQIPIETTNES